MHVNDVIEEKQRIDEGSLRAQFSSPLRNVLPFSTPPLLVGPEESHEVSGI